MEEVLNQMHYDGTQLSKFLNRKLLLDKTGRSITQTIMEGSWNLTDGRFMFSGEGAHAIMIGGTGCLLSKNKNLQLIGSLVWIFLAFTYIAGRQNKIPMPIQK